MSTERHYTVAELRALRGEPIPRKPLDYRDMSEKVFQAWVIKEAESRGWRVYHTYDSRRCAAGFPDLVMCRPEKNPYDGRTLFVELKTQTGRVSKEQQAWIDDLEGCQNVCYVWRPSDIDEILRVLG